MAIEILRLIESEEIGNHCFTLYNFRDLNVIFRAGHRRRRRDERVQEVERSRGRDERVAKLHAAPLPSDPDLHQCREELDHHLPASHRHVEQPDEEIRHHE